MSHSPEPYEHAEAVAALEQELGSCLEAIRAATHNHDYEHAEEIAQELASHDQPDEFRLEGLFALGRFATREGKFDAALTLFEEARRLAVNTESYDRAAKIQQEVGWLYRDMLGDQKRASAALRDWETYAQAAGRFPSRRFERIALHD